MKPPFIPAVIAVALIGGRVIGVRLGWRRAVLMSWLGLASAEVVLQAMARVDTSWRGPVAVTGLGLVATVVWGAVAEVVVPQARRSGSGRRVNPLRAAKDGAGRLRRKAQLGWLALTREHQPAGPNLLRVAALSSRAWPAGPASCRGASR